jgi:hypothetical protein
MKREILGGKSSVYLVRVRKGDARMAIRQVQQIAQRPWLKPMGRAFLAILIGVYGQLAIAILVWLISDSPDKIGALGEFGIKAALTLVECSVLLFLVLDKESLRKYFNLGSWQKSLLLGTLGAVPLLVANRVLYGWIIRFIHGEFDFYSKLTGSNLGGVSFLLLQCVYYILEIFILVYAYAKLAEGLRLWRPLSRWAVVVIGWLFLFVTWGLAHGFVVADLLSFGIGLYLPLAFVVLYEMTDNALAPTITWLLFLAI